MLNRGQRQRKKRLGYNVFGKLIEACRLEDAKLYLGQITMYSPPSSVRSDECYKILYLNQPERELLNLDTENRAWSIMESKYQRDGFVGRSATLTLNEAIQ